MNDLRLDHLIDQHLDGGMAAEERAELEACLRHSAADRARFWDRAETHILLREGLQRLTAEAPAKKVRRWRRPFAWSAAVAAALLLAVLVALPRRVPEPLASLSAATDARWSDPNVELTLRGGELPPGPLRLEAGAAEFAFSGGATAVIEGPAVFEVVAADRLLLRAGRVIGRCAKDAAKLTIVTPTAQVTDLGTEFGVAVDADRQTRVAVIRGAVQLVAGEQPRRLNAGQAVAVDVRGGTAPAAEMIAEFSKVAAILPAEELPVHDAANRLLDPAITDLTHVWNGTVGHVERNAAGRVRISANGSRLWPLLWQDVPTGAIAGHAVVAAVQALQPDEDPLRGLQNAIIKVVFLDAAGREFARAERHFLRSSAPRGQWIRGQIAAIAPAGTARVQFQVLLNARGLKTGSLLFKDPSLVVMEAP